MSTKVVFLLRYWATHGGGETVTITLANEMVKRGHNVSVLYLWDNNRQNMPFIDGRIKAVRIANKDGRNLKVESSQLSTFLEKYIIDNGISFVINQWWPAEIAFYGCIHTNAVLVKCHHISIQGEWKIRVKDFESLVKKLLGPIYKLISKKLQIRAIEKFYRMSDYVSFLAPSYVEEFKNLTRMKIDSSRVLSIFNPLVYNKTMRVEDYSQKENVALFVGRMNDGQKRIKLLLDIWSKIELSGQCEGWKLELIGTGEDLENAKAHAKKLRLKSISFDGYQQPDAYYKMAKIFMMTSSTEGLPMTLIEAKQNLLCPIVIDTFSSLYYIITNNKDGMIVSNADQFAKVFIDLVNNPKQLKKLGCDTENINRFSVITIVDEWEKLFNRARKHIRL